MAIKIDYDVAGKPIQPTIVLAKRNGDKIGIIEQQDLMITVDMVNANEMSFKVFKEKNYIHTWNEIKTFRLIYCVEWDKWFEIDVKIDEDDDTIKSIVAMGLGEAELSQTNITLQANTEEDIMRKDYAPKIIYSDTSYNTSLLHKMLEKMPHYKIGHVDDTIKPIQRVFDFKDKSIYDCLKEVCEEIGAYLDVDISSDVNGKPLRIINMYDLQSNCNSCGYRGDYNSPCPKCGSTDIIKGYGEDTEIFIDSEDLGNNITLSINKDNVKNCFKLEAGDELMTATIKNINPNGTDYIWNITEDTMKDMSQPLQDKLNSYNSLYNTYNEDKQFNLLSTIINNYNSLINKYKVYKNELKEIVNPIPNYPTLINTLYDSVDFEYYLRHAMMPSVEMTTTTAQLEANKLSSDLATQNVAVNSTVHTKSLYDNAILDYAKYTLDVRYSVKIESSTADTANKKWSGSLKIYNLTKEDDFVISNLSNIPITNDYEKYITQRLQRILSKEQDDYSIVGIFNLDINAFKEELKKYSLKELENFRNACQKVLDLLIEQGISNMENYINKTPNLYNEIYTPNKRKLDAINSEISIRESELMKITGVRDINGNVTYSGLQTEIQEKIKATQIVLDFEKYLGTELFNEFSMFRRESLFRDDNYISEGLSDEDIVKKAIEFMNRAKEEIYKASELQYSIITSLINLLSINEFKPLLDKFKEGNWINLRVDEMLFKLRLMKYDIDFENLNNIQVEFSDTLKTSSGLSDQISLFAKVETMTKEYEEVKRNSSRGDTSYKYVNNWFETGLDTTLAKVIAGSENQAQVIDEHGILLRQFDSQKNDYSPEQMKIINSTIAITNDNWETTKTAIGKFWYQDPVTAQLKEAYGINGETLVGKLLLGEGLGIYSKTGNMTFDDRGLIITNGTNTFTVDPNNPSKLLAISNGTKDVLYTDDKGDLNLEGNIVAKHLTLTEGASISANNITGLPNNTYFKTAWADSIDGSVGFTTTPTEGKKYIGIYSGDTNIDANDRTKYMWSQIIGDNGTRGLDGKSFITWVKYADTDTGVGMSDSPTGKRYLGLAFNKSLGSTPSTLASDYLWSPLYDNVKVGGVNLLLKSDESRTNKLYVINSYTWADKKDIIAGEDYVITIWGSLNSYSTSWYMNMHQTNGTQNLYPALAGAGSFTKIADGVWRAYVKMPALPDGYSWTGLSSLYASPLSHEHTENNTVTKIKVERGNVGTDWSLSNQELASKSDVGKVQSNLDETNLKIEPNTITATILNNTNYKTSLETQLQNALMGGVNYLKEWYGSVVWNSTNNTLFPIVQEKTVTEYTRFHNNGAGSNKNISVFSTGLNSTKFISMDFTKDTFTGSFKIKSENPHIINITMIATFTDGSNYYKYKIFNVENYWKTVSDTITKESMNGRTVDRISWSINTPDDMTTDWLYTKEFQFEKGYFATDFSIPSYELDNRLSIAERTLTPERIMDVVGNSTTYQNTITGLQENIQGAGINNFTLFDADLRKTTIDIFPAIMLTLKPNTKYTVSTDIPVTNGNADVFTTKSISETVSTINNGVSLGNPRTIVTNSDGKLYVVFRNQITYDSVVGKYNATPIVPPTKHVKVEEGSIATLWTPSPADNADVGSVNYAIRELTPESIVDKVVNSEKYQVDTKPEGTRNLLLDSYPNITSSDYNIRRFYLSEKPIAGQKYTITIKGSLNPSKNYFDIYNSGYSIKLTRIITDLGNGYHQKTFIWDNAGNTAVHADTSIWVFTIPNITSKNLVKPSDFTLVGSTIDTTNWATTKTFTLTNGAGSYDGMHVAYPDVKPNTQYTLSFKYKKKSGSLSAMGGHTLGTWSTNTVWIDGVNTGKAWNSGLIGEIVDDTNTHTVEVRFTTPSTIVATDVFYIQPNRMAATAVTVDISELQFEESATATKFYFNTSDPAYAGAYNSKIEWAKLERSEKSNLEWYPAVEETNGANNILQNSSFRNNLDGWVGANTDQFTQVVEDGFMCTKVSGTMNNTKQIHQTLIDDGVTPKMKAGNVYTICGWAKIKNLTLGTINPLIDFTYFAGSGTVKTNASNWNVTGFADMSNKGWFQFKQTFTLNPEVNWTSLTYYIYTRDFTGDLLFRDITLVEGGTAKFNFDESSFYMANVKDVNLLNDNYVTINGEVLSVKERMNNAEEIIKSDSIINIVRNSIEYAGDRANDIESARVNANTTIAQKVGELDISTSQKIDAMGETVSDVTSHFKFISTDIDNPYIKLFTDASSMAMQLHKDRLSFYDGTNELAYMSSNKLYITNAKITDTLEVGNHSFEKYGNLTLIKYIGV